MERLRRLLEKPNFEIYDDIFEIVELRTTLSDHVSRELATARETEERLRILQEQAQAKENQMEAAQLRLSVLETRLDEEKLARLESEEQLSALQARLDEEKQARSESDEKLTLSCLEKESWERRSRRLSRMLPLSFIIFMFIVLIVFWYAS